MHMDNPAVTRALVQIIDVLRHQQKTIAKRLFQLRQRQMRGIRRDFRALQLAAAGVIKRLHQRRVAGKTFRCRHVLHPVFFPQAVGGAEGFNPRLCRNTGAG